MSEPYVGEIRMFAGNYAPAGWALCDGQLLPVSENDALFSLFGTTYGGDGRTTFGLPDLRGRIPIHAGSGPGLTPRVLGQPGGTEQVQLTTTNLPSHTHPLRASTTIADQTSPTDNVVAQPNAADLYFAATPSTPLAATALSQVGGSDIHDNVMPFQCVNFIVSLVGIFPSKH